MPSVSECPATSIDTHEFFVGRGDQYIYSASATKVLVSATFLTQQDA